MFAKTPTILKYFFPNLVWEVKTHKKEVYLTFDDGPHPIITPWVLDILNGFNAKATFFCVGENVCKYPEVYQKILQAGHRTGNHSYNHLKGWETDDSLYVENIEKARQFIDSDLLRPPHGRISRSQIKKLKDRYRIIMWSALSYDFDTRVSGHKCYRNSISVAKPGSIVVFHDSEKARKNLEYAFPKYLQHFADMGYKFKHL
jgi:peptidoglycan/xylan/chitin deacetylase (PgdA/CDA1 family)